MLLYVHTGDAAGAGSAAYRPPAAEEARGWGDTGPMGISKWLYQAAHISLYLPISPHISKWLYQAAHISLYLPISPHVCKRLYQAAQSYPLP